LINQILRDYFHNEFGQGDKCFDVVATLTSGCWTLFAASLIYIFVSNMIMRLCHSAIQEDNTKKTQRSHNIQYSEEVNAGKHDGCCNCGFLVSFGKLIHVISFENNTCRVESDIVGEEQ